MRAGGDGPRRIGNDSAQVGPPPERPDEEDVTVNPGIAEREPEPVAVYGIAASPEHLTRSAGRGLIYPPAEIQIGADFFRGIVTAHIAKLGAEETPIDLQGLETLKAANGAKIYYTSKDEATLRVVGYLYDVVPFLYDLMDSFDGPERFSRYYSPATIVRDLEWAHGDSESGEFTNASKTVSVKWNRDLEAGSYEFEIHFSNPPSRTVLKWSLERFAGLTVHEITDIVESSLSVGNVSRRIEGLLRDADSNEILQMIKLTAPNVDVDNVALWHKAIHESPNGIGANRDINDGVAPNSGLFVGNIDVGIRMKGDFVTSIVLIFNQGKRIDETGRVSTENRSTWVGSPIPEGNGFVWEIDDTFAPHAKNAAWDSDISKPLRRFVFSLFRDGLTHRNSASHRPPIGGGADTPPPKPPHGTGTPTGRRSAAHYLGHERSVRRGATARLGARRVFPRVSLMRRPAGRTVL